MRTPHSLLFGLLCWLATAPALWAQTVPAPRYAVVIASARSMYEARKVVAAVLLRNIKARALEMPTPEGVRYRVIVGEQKDKAGAESLRDGLRRGGYADAWVIDLTEALPPPATKPTPKPDSAATQPIAVQTIATAEKPADKPTAKPADTVARTLPVQPLPPADSLVSPQPAQDSTAASTATRDSAAAPMPKPIRQAPRPRVRKPAPTLRAWSDRLLAVLQSGDLDQLRRYIHPEAGLFVLHNPGAFPVAEQVHTVAELTEIAILRDSARRALLRLEASAYQQADLHEKRLPLANCPDGSWPETGAFLGEMPPQSHRMEDLWRTMKQQALGQPLTLTEQQQVQQADAALEYGLVMTGAQLLRGLYFTRVDGEWYLAGIDLLPPCLE